MPRESLPNRVVTFSFLLAFIFLLAALSAEPQTAEQIATTAGVPDAAETVYFLLEHLAANGRARSNGTDAPGQTTFCKP